MNGKNISTHKAHAIRVLLAYGAGVLVLGAIIHSPLSIPCISKLLFDAQCPGCGLTRSFVMASQFNLWGAMTMNILFLPLTIGMIVYFACALIDAFTDRQAIDWLNSALSSKWIIAAAVLLMLASWYYNVVRGI